MTITEAQLIQVETVRGSVTAFEYGGMLVVGLGRAGITEMSSEQAGTTEDGLDMNHVDARQGLSYLAISGCSDDPQH